MRKKPKQKRSKEMVARLITATAEVLAERGLDDTTTNHIAEHAGVSVGSLYQYFPDKESLIEALLERMINEITRTFNRQLGERDLGKLEIGEISRLVMQVGLTALRANPLYVELLRNWHRLPVMGPLDQLEQYFMTVMRLYFVEHVQSYPVKNLQAKLYVLINSNLFTLARYLSQETPVLKEEAVIDALVAMNAATLAQKE
jgi:AcrR family transcriptional regulator